MDRDDTNHGLGTHRGVQVRRYMSSNADVVHDIGLFYVPLLIDAYGPP